MPNVLNRFNGLLSQFCGNKLDGLAFFLSENKKENVRFVPFVPLVNRSNWSGWHMMKLTYVSGTFRKTGGDTKIKNEKSTINVSNKSMEYKRLAYDDWTNNQTKGWNHRFLIGPFSSRIDDKNQFGSHSRSNKISTSQYRHI